MKKVLIPLVVLLGLLTASVAFAAEHSLNEAFRGIPWGTPDSELVSKYGLEKGQFLESDYKRSDDNLSMGNIPVNSITYQVNSEGRFYQVVIRASLNHSGALVQLYQQLLGPEATSSPKEYMWDVGKVRVWLEVRPAPHSAAQPYTLITIARKSEEAMKNQGGGL